MSDLNKYLFNINIEGGIAPERGRLLVAEPFLAEEYFNHAVICLVDYSLEGGAMGVVLNKPTQYTLGAIFDGVDQSVDVPIFCGGPMSTDRLYFLHTVGELIPGGKSIAPGLYLGGDIDAMTDYVNSHLPTEGRIRFFLGYSGWSPGQLDEEIKQHTWAVSEAPVPIADLLRDEKDHYWHDTVKRLGPDFRGWLYHPQYVISN